MTWWGSGALVFGAALLSGAPTEPRRHEVEIRGMAFHPAVLEVASGDTVVWVNRDIVPHTATAKPAWDTGTLTQGRYGTIVSRQPGEFRYVCTLHPTMRGTLVTR